MPARDPAQGRGRRLGEHARAALAAEIRNTRLAAGVGQRQVARASGLSQSVISRIERNTRSNLTIDEAAVVCAVLGLRLHVKAYPAGSPVRDAGQLRVAGRFRGHVSEAFIPRTEVLIGAQGDPRAWDVHLGGPASIGIDIETRLHDLQALQRRLELKFRDSGVERVILVVAGTRHNRAVNREHRAVEHAAAGHGRGAAGAAGRRRSWGERPRAHLSRRR